MVEGIDDISNILAHIAVDIPLTFKELRCLIYKVCCEYAADIAVLISLIELIKSACEETESRAAEDPAGLTLLKLICNFQHTLT